MKKDIIIMLIPLLLADCRKPFEFRGWAPPPPGFVPIPREVWDRFHQYVGEYYHYGTVFINDSSRHGRFAIGKVLANEPYPADSAEYKSTVLDKDAQMYFGLIFSDQVFNSPFLSAYDMPIHYYFKLEPGEVYRKSIEVNYLLTDSLFK